MLARRLSRAFESGALALPARGRIAVFGARAGDDLSLLPADRLQIVQGLRPDHDALAAQGLDTVASAEGRYAAALVRLPRARAAGEAMIADAAARSDGAVIVDGQKEDGVEALLRACRARTTVEAPVIRAHGKLFVMPAPGADLADWAARARVLPEGFETWPGVFSADGVDPGSALLAAALPDRLAGRVADLGAGWGYLAAQALRRDAVSRLDLIEADHAALGCARRNVSDSRARFHWADATAFAPDAPYDAVITNPPFHSGRAADPALGQAFIAAAAGMLMPQGVLWLVANRHLPYMATLQARFRDVDAPLARGGYCLYRAARPVGQGRPARRDARRPQPARKPRT